MRTYNKIKRGREKGRGQGLRAEKREERKWRADFSLSTASSSY